MKWGLESSESLKFIIIIIICSISQIMEINTQCQMRERWLYGNLQHCIDIYSKEVWNCLSAPFFLSFFLHFGFGQHTERLNTPQTAHGAATPNWCIYCNFSRLCLVACRLFHSLCIFRFAYAKMCIIMMMLSMWLSVWTQCRHRTIWYIVFDKEDETTIKNRFIQYFKRLILNWETLKGLFFITIKLLSRWYFSCVHSHSANINNFMRFQ